MSLFKYRLFVWSCPKINEQTSNGTHFISFKKDSAHVIIIPEYTKTTCERNKYNRMCIKLNQNIVMSNSFYVTSVEYRRTIWSAISMRHIVFHSVLLRTRTTVTRFNNKPYLLSRNVISKTF